MTTPPDHGNQPPGAETETLSPERERGRRIEAFLDALEGIPPDRHEDYLAGACPDPELRRAILAIQAAKVDSRGYLSQVAARLGRQRTDPVPLELSGRRVGAWRLLKPLGRGGMGVVYEAERADGTFEQRVALKLLATALVGGEAHQRFLAERRILARLEHPAIARIIDGGVTEDNTPWFAMERIDGVPINIFCDQRRLGVRARLALFLEVCDAIEHAHRRLIVHRDLKPANVLVTDDGQIKLLDFGIAKLLDSNTEIPAAPATRTSSRLMTPEYASPEQVRGAEITTSSDVYQLGLLLHELLTGSRPYVLRRPGITALERAICEEPPTRLSAVIQSGRTGRPWRAGASDTVDTVCQLRRSSPSRLQRQFRGDLENIVLKALSKEPERRYGSADRLAQDIRRHLSGLPVTARPDTWRYRSLKFLGRHAMATAATAIVLMLGTAMGAFYTVRIQGERDVAQIERGRAEHALARAEMEAVKSRQVSEFLAGVFRASDPREARGRELTSRELLDRGVRRVNRELAAQPDIQAEMLHVLGRTYSDIGDYAAAETLLEQALELRRSMPDGQGQVADVLRDFGVLRIRQGRYDRARTKLHEAMTLREATSGADSAGIADLLSQLGPAYWRLGEHEEAMAVLKRALVIQRRIHGEHSTSVAANLASLCTMVGTAGDLQRARALCEQALAIRERELEPDHPLVGSSMRVLAFIRQEQGEHEGLEAVFRHVLAVQTRAYGEQHSNVVAALNSLGHYLAITGRHQEAMEMLERAIAAAEAAEAAGQPAVATPLVTLGDLHRTAGRLIQARELYSRGVAMLGATLGERRFDLILTYSLGQLGGVEIELGEDETAAGHFERALALWRQAPATVDPQLASSLPPLARWLAQQHRCADAAPLFRRVLQSPYTRQQPGGPVLAELERLAADCPAA